MTIKSKVYDIVEGMFTKMTLSVVLCGYAIARDSLAVPFRNQFDYRHLLLAKLKRGRVARFVTLLFRQTILL